ncbi:L-aspartate oxidase [Halocatena pleomorpha]|uniref:FAD-dependent oxidoreductase n=1 Tax=Halocatena pleomorpha TaxID=1785090 RepID=A0A3P3R7S0_9EURY|nr:FAD-dependent oxidoreductase [Halocatena pleomorpha]RRJ29405.1 FAD-dependent oxidoreductase [Halocatena pleomorpha]
MTRSSEQPPSSFQDESSVEQLHSSQPTEDDTQATSSVDYEHVSVPVLVIGAGAAGVRTAIELAEHDVEPLVIGKRDHGDAHTTLAAGGINAALGNRDPEDDWQIHAADTLKEGHFINDANGVETVANAMPDRIRELEEWGMPFNRTEDGKIEQRYFGAQSFRRTCFVGDRTGEAMLEALVSKARALEIPYRENVMITKLLSDGERAYGAIGYDMDDGHFLRFGAHAVVLAAGGYSGLYNRHSSRIDENNGDGVALAYDAGARLMDIEFVQFHPTGMIGDRYGEDWDGRLVTEAVRGEGGRLFNAEGERFMKKYSPDQMELDARDVVARAISQEISEGRDTENGGVYLDISHKDRAFLQDRLPRMYERFAELGVDMAEEPVEVAPTAHYAMGGVEVDFETGATAVENLYAVGETIAGIHGANRLGGNSLSETVVLGKVVGDHLADESYIGAPELPASQQRAASEHFRELSALSNGGSEDPQAVLQALGDLLEETAGIIRTEEGTKKGLERLEALNNRADNLVAGERTSRSFEYAIDLGFSLTVAKALFNGARERTESRGAHFRSDYPEKNEAWRKNITYRQTEDGITLDTTTPGEPSDVVSKALDADYELDYHQLE